MILVFNFYFKVFFAFFAISLCALARSTRYVLRDKYFLKI